MNTPKKAVSQGKKPDNRFEELLQELKEEHQLQLEANDWKVDQLLMQNSALKNRVAKLEKELEIRNALR